MDLAAQLQSITKVPDTFEELAIKILNDIPREYENIYNTCDTYHDISIKAPEQSLRGESQKLLIRSAQIRTPSDFQQFLCNGENKERLFELIENTWIREKEILENCIVHFARGKFCCKISNEYVSEVGSLTMRKLTQRLHI